VKVFTREALDLLKAKIMFDPWQQKTETEHEEASRQKTDAALRHFFGGTAGPVAKPRPQGHGHTLPGGKRARYGTWRDADHFLEDHKDWSPEDHEAASKHHGDQYGIIADQTSPSDAAAFYHGMMDQVHYTAATHKRGLGDHHYQLGEELARTAPAHKAATEYHDQEAG